MKKIIAVLIALLISINILSFNCIKANAVAAPASLLTYLIEACYTILVGSGTVSQSDFNNMNTSEVFDTTTSLSSNIELSAKVKADFIKNFNQFLNDAISKQLDDTSDLITGGGISEVIAEKYVDFVYGHVNDLGTYNPELNGFGAMAVVEIYNKSDGSLANTAVYFGDYGIISKGVFAEIYGDEILRQYTSGSTYKETEHSGSYTCGGAFVDDNYIFAKVKFIGDWRYTDGTPATDMLTFVQEVPESIGTVEVDGTTYDVTGDGTVTIGDTTYTINDDGTVTINGDTYYPTYDVTPYDDTALLDLLNDILNQIQVTEDDKAADLIDEAEIEVPIEIANSEFSSLTLPKTILTVFPFCIPVDFYNGIKLLSQPPKAPRFEVPFEIPEFGLFPGYKKMIVLDFSEYESAFYVVRWVTFGLFMFGLCFVTFKIVKGA